AADRGREDAKLKALSQEAQTALEVDDYRRALDICALVLSTSIGSQPCAAIRQHAAVKLAEEFVEESTAHWEKGEFDQALLSAKKALELDPANTSAAKLKRLALHMKQRASQ